MSLNITVNCDKVIVDTSFAPNPVAGAYVNCDVGAPGAASVAPQDLFDDVPPEQSVDGASEPAMVDCVATALADRAEAANEYAQTAADHAQAAAARALTYSTSAATALADVNRATTAAQLAQANCLASHTATVDAAETCQTSLAEVRRLLYATQACVDTNRPRAAVPAVAPIRRRTYKRPAANPWSRIAKRPATAENVDSIDVDRQ